MSELAGKCAIITGGASGIGEATAKLLASRGVDVVVVDLNASECERVSAEIGETGSAPLVVPGDIRDSAVIKNAIRAAVDRYGAVDILVNSAGVGELKPSSEVTEDNWRRTLSINLDAAFFVSQAVLRTMQPRQQGAIVNVASIHGVVGFPAHAAYSASKGAVVNLTRSLALEYAMDGIRVNAVCPGFVQTPMIAAGVTDELMPEIVAMHPLGRIGEPDEIAKAISFLASDEASFITGAALLVDGGYTAR